jgi:hypothetical protein
MARVVAPLNFNAFLQKAKLKDDGSNYVDCVRNLRIILWTKLQKCQNKGEKLNLTKTTSFSSRREERKWYQLVNTYSNNLPRDPSLVSL